MLWVLFQRAPGPMIATAGEGDYRLLLLLSCITFEMQIVAERLLPAANLMPTMAGIVCAIVNLAKTT